MILQVPIVSPPSWLSSIQTADDMTEFPLSGILRQSVFYPSSGFDGRPVQFLAKHFHSFIYADYGNTKSELTAALRRKGFRGYHVLAEREVGRGELGLLNLQAAPWRGTSDLCGHSQWVSEFVKPPFCQWFVFERDPIFDERHGPTRFSLLYMCYDGLAAYRALYVSNQTRPAVVAIIQPGHGFGGNWTNFEDPSGPFYLEVLGNPAGQPEFMLFGGALLQKS